MLLNYGIMKRPMKDQYRITDSVFVDWPFIVRCQLTKDSMENEKEEQDVRSKFYNSQSVVKYIKTAGTPKTKGAWKEMVASGSSEDLDSEKGLELIACLGKVVFMKHPQQINIMDKSNGKIIATID